MHALVVVSHPFEGSFSHAVARRIIDGIADAGHTAELADLAAEGFDAAYGIDDYRAYRGEIETAPAVVAEQERVDRADALVVVYPVYWWSMPSLLKGWFDRVFTRGWAYGGEASEHRAKNLTGLDVHFFAIVETSPRTYDRRGYREAMRTQIESGIFGYCDAEVKTSELYPITEEGFVETSLGHAYDSGSALFAEREAPRVHPARPEYT